MRDEGGYQSGQRQSRGRVTPFFAPLVAVAVVASVIGAFAAIGHLRPFSGLGGSAGALASSHTISIAQTAHLYCPTGAAFSSDGAHLAVIGASTPCSAASSSAASTRFVSHGLAIYDGRTGAYVRTIPLDALIGAGSVQPGTLRRVRAVEYVGLGWAPNSPRYAVAFTAFDSSTSALPDNVVSFGLLLVDTTTGTGVVIPGDPGFSAAPTGAYSGLPIWNVTQDVVSAPTLPQPGLAYAWGKDGQPEAIIPLSQSTLSQLPINAGPRYPVGNPAGGSTFTIWQSGVVLGSAVSSEGSSAGAGQSRFIAVFPSWSANGSYVTMMVTGVALPASTASATADTNTAPPPSPMLPTPATLTSVPARDAALSAVQAQVGANGWALVGWNPNGTLLASVNCLDNNGEALTLRRTDTGASVGSSSLPLASGDQGCAQLDGAEDIGDYPNPALWLLWSPDGGHILISDQRAATLTLWSVSQQ